MLLELHIKNYALIEEVVLEFGPGFNVLTGETGAGKSIIIDAVTLLLGGRGALEYIRTGAKEAFVCGVFSISNKLHLQQILSDLGLKADDDDTLIISCSILSSGRSQRRINGRPVTQSTLAEIGEHLVDIHGQHQHQALLKQAKHIEYLDNFSENIDLKKEVSTYYYKLNKMISKYKSLSRSEDERKKRLDLLQYQIPKLIWLFF